MIDDYTRQWLILFAVCSGVAIGLSQGIAYILCQLWDSREERLKKFDGPASFYDGPDDGHVQGDDY
jgi:hypothetical protein